MSRISDEELRRTLEAATPGPWHMMPMQGPRKQTNFARVYATDDDLRYIADCRDFMCFHEITDNEANARLIALAPALAAEVLQLREALQPFAIAWNIAQAGGIQTLGQLGALARNEVSAHHFRKAAAALPGGRSNV